jgi:hypothetical protein
MGDRASCIHLLQGYQEGRRLTRLAGGSDDGPLVVLQDLE